jgi:hypothetical protein
MYRVNLSAGRRPIDAVRGAASYFHQAFDVTVGLDVRAGPFPPGKGKPLESCARLSPVN